MGSSPTGGTTALMDKLEKSQKCLYDERVDMRALETRAERRVGANPTTGTYKKFYIFVSSRINYYICARTYFYERTNTKTLV